MKTTVLDSWAILAYLNGEPGSKAVLKRLEDAGQGNTKILLHKINLGEVYYMALRRTGRSNTDRAINWLLQCPITLVELEDEILFEAARLKAYHPISYADCFVAATAITKGGSILTGDPEFRKVEDKVSIEWVSVQ